jgi:DNA-binding NtrC family response regulator
VPPSKAKSKQPIFLTSTHTQLGHFISLKNHMRLYINYVYEQSEGNIEQTLHILEISRSTLYRYLDKPTSTLGFKHSA